MKHESIIGRTRYESTVQLPQLKCSLHGGLLHASSAYRSQYLLSQLLQGGLLAIFIWFQRRGWRRRTRLASNQCCRQFYPQTIKRFAGDQAHEHAGGYSSHVEKGLAHRGETRTDDGSQGYIVKTDHAHTFRHMNVAQVERLIYTHCLQVVSCKDRCGRLRQSEQSTGLSVARLETKIAGANELGIDGYTSCLQSSTIPRDSIQTTPQRGWTSNDSNAPVPKRQ